MDARINPQRPTRSASLPAQSSPREALPAPATPPGADTLAAGPPAAEEGAHLVTPRLPHGASGLTAPQVPSAPAQAFGLGGPDGAARPLVFTIVQDLEDSDDEGEILDPDSEAGRQFLSSFVDAHSLRGVTEGLASGDMGADAGPIILTFLNEVMGLFAPAVDEAAIEAATAEVEAALRDVPAWYTALDPARSEALRVSRDDDYSCAISQKSFVELEHPVAVRTGAVVHVFEAEDILQWIKTSMQSESHPGKATNPIDRQPLSLAQLTRAQNVAFGPIGPARG